MKISTSNIRVQAYVLLSRDENINDLTLADDGAVVEKFSELQNVLKDNGVNYYPLSEEDLDDYVSTIKSDGLESLI